MTADDLRVLQDAALPGPVNMARDEALLTGVGAGKSPPTLRLYQWCEPTVSLGYFQPFAELEQFDPCVRRLAVVRRMTGGGAILHDLELTYSLTLPVGHALLGGGPNALYERAHDAIIACFRDLGVDAWRGCAGDGSGAARGPFFCFARRHCFDVLVGAEKLAGSAQRRTPRAVLQHGSIIVASRFSVQPTARFGAPCAELLAHLRADFPNRIVPLDAAERRAGDWAPHELQAAEALIPKYGGAEWTRRI